MDPTWYHVCWPRLTAKRVEPVVSISWASCVIDCSLFLSAADRNPFHAGEAYVICVINVELQNVRPRWKFLYATNVLRWVLHVTGHYKSNTAVYVYMQFSFSQTYEITLRPILCVFENFCRKFANLVAPPTDGTMKCLAHCKAHSVP